MVKGAKWMKRPNGFGTLGYDKKSKNYHPRVTEGFYYDKNTKRVKQRTIGLGTYKTKEEALDVLSKYRTNKDYFKRTNVTFAELYQMWSEEKFQMIKKSGKESYSLAFKVCMIIHNKRIMDLKLYDLQKVIDTCGKNYPSLTWIKLLMRQMMEYAMAHDLIEKDYSEFVNVSKYRSRNPNRQVRDRFSVSQIEKMWKNQKTIYDSIVLILIYTGVRINELLSLRKEDLHLEENYFYVKKSKTESGIRKVPIADKIKPFFAKWLEITPENYEFVFTDQEGKKLKDQYYRRHYFKPMMDMLGSNLTPHCCRHTCISLLAEAGVNPVYTKMIVGHKRAMSLTDAVYTHIDITVLVNEINKI